MIKGILFAIIANLLFGTLYYFAILLRPLQGEAMLGFRILTIFPFILLGIFLFEQQSLFKDLYQKIKQNPWLIFILLFTATNTAFQFWIFLWAPNNGQAIPVSMGYLLLPIVMVAMGKWVFKEYLSPLKWGALIFAMIGVGSNILLAGEISWATLLVGVGYPLYFTLRKLFKINHLVTFLVELIILFPIAFYFISTVPFIQITEQNQAIYLYLILLGLVSGTAFILFISATNLLPINVLGLLGYLEPLVMFIISFTIGEKFYFSTYLLMACLASAILLLILDSFIQPKKL